MKQTPKERGIETAKFFLKDGSMTNEDIIKFFKEQASNARRNSDRTNSLVTMAKNTERAEEFESAIKFMEENNE